VRTAPSSQALFGFPALVLNVQVMDFLLCG
jgi:hypothetical protein